MRIQFQKSTFGFYVKFKKKMNTSKLLEIISYTIPSIITGGIAYYFFYRFLHYNAKDKEINLVYQKKKESLPIKLQAYERMLLFCERINPIKLTPRVKPIGNNNNDYLQLLIANIEQEFEHNLVQQIYISDVSWTAITASKNAVIHQLKKISEGTENTQEFREKVLLEYTIAAPPIDTAIAILKNEVRKLL